MYSSFFRRAAQDCAVAANLIAGEPVTVTPTSVVPNFQAAPSKALKPFTILADYTDFPLTAVSPWAQGRNKMPQGVSRQGNDTKGVISSQPAFTFTQRDLPFPIRQKYQITNCLGEIFEVVDVRYDGYAFTRCEVVRLGKPSTENRIIEATEAAKASW